uniref:DUF4806 domain-containing protein n=1 Tax=Anopheles christyi TaxID=43041 RepID=A0A182JS90_9DIPT
MSAIGRRRIMTRTRTESIGLRSNVTTTTTTSTTCLYPTRQPVTASSEVEMNGSMDSAIMASADALATGDEMVVVADVSSSIEHHHQSSLMNGITVTLANGGTVTVGGGGEEEDGDSNNKYDVADKDEHDLEHEEEEEEDVEEEEEEDEDEPVPMQDEEQHNVDVKITVDKLQLQMMQTDDDPLLQETINALMNGSGGIEVVNTSEHDPIEPTATDVTDDPSIVNRNSSTVTALVAGTNGLVAAGEEDYTTGDSERFFKSYDLPDGSVAMKLEPDISLTEDADVSEEVGGPEAMLATEEVETAEEQLQQQIVEEQEEDPNAMQECVAPGAGSEIRYQIMEERIKSLQREVHMVNKNLSRVESKVDGLTRIISLFIGKFEDETELANQAAQQQQQHQEQQDQKSEQEQEQEQEYTTVSPEGETIVPIAMMTPEQQQHSSSSTSPSIQPKTIFLTSTSAALQSASAAQVQVQPVTVFQSASSPTITPRQHRSGTVAKETHTNTHYYQFTDPTTVVHLKPEGSPSPRVSSPSPTPPPGTVHTSVQHLTLASNGGNQLLDTFPDIPELPIRTVSDFLDLNDHCTDNEQFLLQMMIRLHQEIHNSQPFQRNIKRMMEALVTYEVLCQFSWSGKSAINGQYTKYVFGNSLGIIDLLTKTLNLGKSAQEAEANHKPIFAAIQSFIKHSRQNMIRDSRKRRDPMRSVLSLTGAGGEMVAGMVPDTTTAIAYHINGGERLQTKQQRSERHHHQQTELVNPF